MNSDNKVEIAIAGLNFWVSYTIERKRSLITSFATFFTIFRRRLLIKMTLLQRNCSIYIYYLQ